MGCGASQVDRRRMRAAYHGVAFPAATASQPAARNRAHPKGTVSLSDTAHFTSFSDGPVSESEGNAHDKEDAVGVVRLQRHTEREVLKRKNQKTATRTVPTKRRDHLLNFGNFHLRMVDELATAQVDAIPACEPSVSGTASSAGCSLSWQGGGSEDSSLGTDLSAHSATCGGTVLLASHANHTPRRCVVSRSFKVTLCGNTRKSCPATLATSDPDVRGFRLNPIGGHAGPVRILLASPGGDQLFSCAKDSCTVQVHHLGLGCVVGHLGGDAFGVVVSGDVSASGQLVATASRDATLVIWDAMTRKMRRALPHPGVVRCCRFDPTGTRLVTACQDGLCREWEVASGREVGTFASHHRLVSAISYSTDGSRILSGGSDRRILVWRTQHSAAATTTATAVASISLSTPSFAHSGPARTANSVSEASEVAFADHVDVILSIHVRRPSGLVDDVVVSADKRLVVVWDLGTLTRVASFDVCMLRDTGIGSGASRRAHWTAANFAPPPFDRHILVATHRRSLHMLRFMPEHASVTSPVARPTRRGSSPPRLAVSAPQTHRPLGDDGVALPINSDRQMIRRPRRTRSPDSAANTRSPTGRRSEEDNGVTLHFRAPVTAIFCPLSGRAGPGPTEGGSPSSSQVVLGDRHGNIHLLRLW